MKILSICYEYPPLGGGGAKVVAGLLRELGRQGHHIDLVTMGYRGQASYEERGNLRIHRIPGLRRSATVCRPLEMAAYLLLAFGKVLRLCRENRYDLNHTHFIFPDGLLALLARKVNGLPFLITAHGSDVPGYNPDRFRLLHRLLVPVWKAVVDDAAEIVFPSRSLQSLALEIRPRLATAVIPNGFQLWKFSPAPRKKKTILLVSRMFQRKGVQYLLQALTKLEHDFEVHIVGDGPFLPNLRKMAGELGVAVRFWGHLANDSPELKELYETSMVFVFTSEAENFPIVLLEAMAAGLAIITTSGTGCAEVVGETALLVEPHDPEGLAGALGRYLQDPGLCLQMGRHARKRLEEKFSWPAVAAQYVEKYESISFGSRRVVPAMVTIETAEEIRAAGNW